MESGGARGRRERWERWEVEGRYCTEGGGRGDETARVLEEDGEVGRQGG